MDEDEVALSTDLFLPRLQGTKVQFTYQHSSLTRVFFKIKYSIKVQTGIHSCLLPSFDTEAGLL